MRRVVAAAVGMALGLAPGAALAEPLPQVAAWIASGRPAPPPQGKCPAVANIDLAALAREEKRSIKATPSQPAQDILAKAQVPAGAARRPGPDATVVLRELLPPGGLYNSELRSVVWRDGAGVWWFWRQSLDYSQPPPLPPPPPPPEDSPDYAAWKAQFGDWKTPTTDDERWPPVEGRLSLQRAARLEAALNDPCRAWDPDFWPWEVPLKRRVDGARTRPCPPDGGAYYAEIVEPGRPARRIGAGCINDSPTFQIISAAAYPSAED